MGPTNLIGVLIRRDLDTQTPGLCTQRKDHVKTQDKVRREA
jgi:hypothetical protein